MAHKRIEDLLAAYRSGAEGTSTPDPKVANRWQKQMHECYKRLQETSEGRAAIATLMNDPSPHVKCWAAAHCLQWEPSIAKSTLQELQIAKGPCSFTAEMTLQEFGKGRLTFDN